MMAQLTSSRMDADSRTYARSARYVFSIGVIGLLCIGLSISAGIRSFGTGRDFLEYLQFYGTITPYSVSNYSRFETGFEVTAWLFANILKQPFETFFIFLALLSLSIKFYLFKRYLLSPWLAILSYILLFYSIHEYTQIRTAVAVSFAYLAIHLLLEKKYITSNILIFLAFLFHSSILLIGLASITIFVIPKRLYALFTLLSTVLLFSFYGFIGNFIKDYFSEINPLVALYVDNSDFSVEVNVFSVTNILLMLSLISCYALGYLKNNRYCEMFFFLGCIAFVWLIIFQNSPVIALRTAYMLFVAIIFLVFRAKFSYQSAAPQLLVLLAAGWGFYRAISEGVINL